VDGTIGRHINLSHLTQGRQQVHAANGLAALAASLNVPRPADDARYANAAIVNVTFLLAERASRTVRVVTGDGRTVVAGEPNQGAVAELQFVDRLHDPAECFVHLRDIPVVGRIA